jgi:plastocyanin
MTGTVVVAAASGATPAEPAAPTPAPTPTPAATPVVPAAGTESVGVRDFVFAPVSLAIPVGTEVTFSNTGAAPHTVTEDSGAFDSGLIAAGASWSRRFEVAGTFPYVCSFHPEMTGEIVVGAAAAAFATPTAGPTDSGGSGLANPAAAGPGVPVATIGSAAVPAGASIDGVARLAIVVLIVGAGVALFMRTIAGSVRRPV